MNITESPAESESADVDDTADAESTSGAADSEEAGVRDADETAKERTEPKRRSISLSLRGLSIGLLIAVLVAALGVMTWLYIGANREAAQQVQQNRDNQHAEQVALDYAVRAAVMDHKDLAPWRRALVEGTTPELGKKLTDAATAMEQILIPLQWSSTAEPIAAKVRSHDNGVYIVDAFVSVMTSTVQTPDTLQSTATYAVTINPADGWKITDVGGIGQVVGEK
ncbi:hypothetical protein [Mycobacterium sp. C31M]